MSHATAPAYYVHQIIRHRASRQVTRVTQIDGDITAVSLQTGQVYAGPPAAFEPLEHGAQAVCKYCAGLIALNTRDYPCPRFVHVSAYGLMMCPSRDAELAPAAVSTIARDTIQLAVQWLAETRRIDRLPLADRITREVETRRDQLAGQAQTIISEIIREYGIDLPRT